jgi:predicted site-specific integrase-resolvase
MVELVIAYLEGLHVRISVTAGQESSLDAPEAGLRATATEAVTQVFRDHASGLREDRRGLGEMLPAAAGGRVTAGRVTHEDRLARFRAWWLLRLLAKSDRYPPGGGQ